VKTAEGPETEWTETAKAVWKDEVMNELLKQIRKQQTTMALLVQTLQM
jgi:hypothetical protein